MDLGNSLAGGYYLLMCVSYAAGLSLTYIALTFSWFGDQVRPHSRLHSRHYHAWHIA